ncbi:MAG: tetratricopeptide repeat protein [Candidatus Faecousia sp.]|nr:tetratricopeptide repeat protein [Candidatus Faecousia sp.]
MRKLITYLAATLLCFSLGAQTHSTDSLYLRGVAAFAEGQIPVAKVIFSRLLAVYPEDDAVNYYLGLTELAGREVEAAEKHLLAAERADSTNTWYIYALASLYEAKRDQVRSGEYVEKLIKMAPSLYNNPNTLSVVGDAKAASGQDSLALSYYNQALLLDPEYAPALYGRMELSRRAGRFAPFFVDLEGVIRNEDVRPEMKSNYLTRLMDSIDSPFYWVWGDAFNRLVDLYREMHPEDYAIQLLKLRMLYIKNDWEGVLDQCGVLQELARREGDKDHLAEALSIAGDVLYKEIGDKKKAFAAYEEALKIDPDQATVLNNYAYYLSLEGRKLRKALKMSRRAVELDPDNASYLDTCGWLLYLLKKPKEAKPYFKHAMLYGGKDSAVVLEHYAKVLAALGEDNLASFYQSLSEQKSK